MTFKACVGNSACALRQTWTVGLTVRPARRPCPRPTNEELLAAGSSPIVSESTRLVGQVNGGPPATAHLQSRAASGSDPAHVECFQGAALVLGQVPEGPAASVEPPPERIGAARGADMAGWDIQCRWLLRTGRARRTSRRCGRDGARAGAPTSPPTSSPHSPTSGWSGRRRDDAKGPLSGRSPCPFRSTWPRRSLRWPRRGRPPLPT